MRLTYCKISIRQPGYADWRLPNVKELSSLTDTSKYSPAIDTNNFPKTIADVYWSSTTFVYDTYGTFFVNFGDGFVNFYYKPSLYNVRCVRGGSVNPALPNFRLMHGDSVTPYSTFHDAYDNAHDGDTIQAQADVPTENLTCDSTSDIHVWLKGGYDSGFTSNTGFTTIASFTISSGSATIENIIIQ